MQKYWLAYGNISFSYSIFISIFFTLSKHVHVTINFLVILVLYTSPSNLVFECIISCTDANMLP